MPRLTVDQWETVRAEREAGASFPALAARHGVSHQAIQRHAKREEWRDGADVAGVVRRKAEEKVAGIAALSEKKRAAAIDAAAEDAAAVVRRHRQEWQRVVELRQEALSARGTDQADAFQRAKLAKITAEMTAIQQAGERKAWGLDADKAKADVVVKWEGAE